MTPLEIAKAVLFTAYEASVPMGLGHLHVKKGLTPDQVLDGVSHHVKSDGSVEIYADYVHGRMVKALIDVSPEGEVSVKPDIPRNDYQSWGALYPSASALIEAALSADD